MFMRRKSRSAKIPTLRPAWSSDVGEYVRQVAFNPRGTLQAVATAAAPVWLLDPKTGAVLRELSGHTQGVTAVSWHPDGRMLASTGHDGHVRLWDARTGEAVWSAKCAAAWVEQCDFRADGRLLAVAAGRSVHLFHPDGRPFRDLTNHPSTVADVRWCPKLDTLLVARSGGMHVWHPEQDEPFRVLNYRGSVLRVCPSPTGEFVATADQNSMVHFWRTKTWKDAEMSGYAHIVSSLSWDSTGRYLATDGGEDVTVWDCSKPGPEGRMPTILKGEPETLTRLVAFAPHREVCATGNESGRISLHTVTADSKSHTLSQLGHPCTVLAWMPGGSQLIAGTANGSVAAFSR